LHERRSKRGLAEPCEEDPQITILPASQRTREVLKGLIEGQLSTASRKEELIKLAARLLVEEALEGEAASVIGLDYCEQGVEPGQDYRNSYRTGRLKTTEGPMYYPAPQIAGRDDPLHSARPARRHQARAMLKRRCSRGR